MECCRHALNAHVLVSRIHWYNMTRPRKYYSCECRKPQNRPLLQRLTKYNTYYPLDEYWVIMSIRREDGFSPLACSITHFLIYVRVNINFKVLVRINLKKICVFSLFRGEVEKTKRRNFVSFRYSGAKSKRCKFASFRYFVAKSKRRKFAFFFAFVFFWPLPINEITKWH